MSILYLFNIFSNSLNIKKLNKFYFLYSFLYYKIPKSLNINE